jgi:uncharacterized protein
MNAVALHFWLVAIPFHLVVGAMAFWLGKRWTVRTRKLRWTWVWLLQLLADSMILGSCALVTGILAALFMPHPAFSAIRLLAQAFFLEGLVLAAAVAAIHYRAGQRKRAVLPGLVALLVAAAYVEAYHREPHDLQIRHHSLDVGRGAEKAKLRVLHLSDLQTHEIGDYERRVFTEAKRLAPDVVVFTGDYLQSRMGSDILPQQQRLRALITDADLRPRYGFYLVGGDVDGWPEWVNPFRGLPVTCLDNSFAQAELPDGDKLCVVGLTNSSSRGSDPAQVNAALDAAPRGDLRLLIGHSPDFVRAVEGRKDVDLCLAGHTHGGQVVLPFVGPILTLSKLPARYAAGGLHRVEGMPLHVSRGIGMERITAPQIRFLCPPEICLIEVTY